jgi:hypothetical protein
LLSSVLVFSVRCLFFFQSRPFAKPPPNNSSSHATSARHPHEPTFVAGAAGGSTESPVRPRRTTRQPCARRAEQGENEMENGGEELECGASTRRQGSNEREAWADTARRRGAKKEGEAERRGHRAEQRAEGPEKKRQPRKGPGCVGITRSIVSSMRRR